MKGDLIVLECVYNTSSDESAIIVSLSPRILLLEMELFFFKAGMEEMCLADIIFYPRLSGDNNQCLLSSMKLKTLLELTGLEEVEGLK